MKTGIASTCALLLGPPSVDPELMIRMLLIGDCQGVRSERRLCEKVHLNLAYRWFCRLGLDGAVPDHSTCSKNRHGRFRDSDLLRKLFEATVARIATAALQLVPCVNRVRAARPVLFSHRLARNIAEHWLAAAWYWRGTRPRRPGGALSETGGVADSRDKSGGGEWGNARNCRQPAARLVGRNQLLSSSSSPSICAFSSHTIMRGRLLMGSL
jgi:hypothetical protein